MKTSTVLILSGLRNLLTLIAYKVGLLNLIIVQENSAKFGVHAGNLNFSTQNVE